MRRDRNGGLLLLVLVFTFTNYERPSLIVYEDIDDKNLHYAQENIARNDFQSRIRPLKTKPDGSLIPLAELGLDRYHLTPDKPTSSIEIF